MRLNVSRPKNQKVVYPPKIPTNKKRRILELKENFSDKANKKPIKKQPVRFTTRVPKGKVLFEAF